MANTFVKIQTVTVGSGGASSIQFTSIPQTYTDLKIVVSCRTNRSDVKDYIAVRPNGSTTNDSSRTLSGDGTSASSDTESVVILVTTTGGTATASVFGNADINIPNYTSANQKSISMDGVGENNATESRVQLSAGLWADTAAITSLDLVPFIGTLFSQYSTATLYGVSNGIKATGGAITSDANYFYHTFTSSGTFTPNQSLIADYLVVAGAGGGGGPGVSGGGGGGAGGVRCTVGATGGGGSLESALSLAAQAYTVTVGAGGAANTIGNNSVFGTITSTAGGRGKDSNSDSNANGGSGGGGNGTLGGGPTNTTGGTGTANQGFAGGNGFPGPGDNARNSGGGGGAGSVGAAGTASVGGNGGSGITTSISGTSTVYAGGGGGGVGFGTSGTGTNGGGNGGNGSTAGVAGTANRGAGGGGGGRNESTGGTQVAGAGGSGIVIVRYAK